MINRNGRQNEYWTALRPKSGSNTRLHMRFLLQLFSFLKPKSLCLWGYLQRRGFWRIYVCLCNRSKPIKRQKKQKTAVLSHRNRDVHTALLFAFQQLKIGCFKTAVLKNTCPFYRCSPSFSSGCSPPGSVSPSRPIAVIQMMKKYRKQCIFRHHEINDRTYETIDFLFRPSDIYRHIAQP